MENIQPKLVSRVALTTVIDERIAHTNSLVIAIDGDAAAGKTTLAIEWGAHFDAIVVQMDHFYLPFNQRNDSSSGHMDFQRLIDTVLIPHHHSQPINYNAYDPHQNKITQTFHKEYKKVLIIEGSYSAHPQLRAYIDMILMMTIDEKRQKERIIKRSSNEVYEKFLAIWIPKEKAYQNETNLLKHVDYQLEG